MRSRAVIDATSQQEVFEMEIQRDYYLKQIIDFMWDGQIKVITGIRRCGKSYMLMKLFKNYLLEHGVEEDEIIIIELDKISSLEYRNPLKLVNYVKSYLENKTQKFYLFIDEIQMSDSVKNPFDQNGACITFYDALNDLKGIANLDIYVTGSNSKMLSKDVLTQFRGRSDEIRMHPLCFAEYYSAVTMDKQEAYDEFALYGGMPLILSRQNDKSKMDYLTNLFEAVYFKAIVERKKIDYPEILSQIVDLLCSSIGSLTNYNKLANALKSKTKATISANTVSTYLNHLEDAFLFAKAKRYDVKGKAYFDFPEKYYLEDVGLRNARLGFRQQEETHIMENIIFNELIVRGYSVDIGVVNKYSDGKKITKEIDFIATSGGKRVYIQSAFALPDEEKREAELESLRLTKDSFPKVIIRQDIRKRWYDDEGVLHINLIDFLLDKNAI